MGSHENVWEMPQDMGNGAGIWGGRQAVWGSQNHTKTRNMGTGRPVDLHIFMNFLWELRFSGRPLKCMGIIKTW